jgi:sigma-B regulation protein RsbU (phosphoserine phosphatase)
LRRQREALAQRAPILSAVQRELAPRDLTQVDGLTVASYLMPAEGVLAGDWFHVFPLEGDFVGVVLGDVAGHGAETGIFALQTKQLIISALRLGLDPGKALSWMAENLGETNEQFVTCIVAVINPETGSCRFANAGHPPAMLKSADSISLLESTGPLVGPFPGLWATGEVILGEHDVLFCFTDGVSEARNIDGEELGVEGVIDMLARAPSDAKPLVEFFVDEIHDRAVNVSDDLTMLAIQRMPESGARG